MIESSAAIMLGSYVSLYIEGSSFKVFIFYLFIHSIKNNKN